MRPSRPRPRPKPRASVALGALALLTALAFATSPRPLQAQSTVAKSAGGAAAGLVAGTYGMLAIYVTKARFGHYLFSAEDALAPRPELLPVVAGPITGAWLGQRSGTALGRSLGWGALGFAGGAAVGAGVGHLIWKDQEGRWAGAIIGSALGLLVGSVWGAHDGLEDSSGPDAPAVPALEFRIPLGGGS
jgi:hypothetical protein